MQAQATGADVTITSEFDGNKKIAPISDEVKRKRIVAVSAIVAGLVLIGVGATWK